MEEIEKRTFNRLLKVLFTPTEKIEISEQIANAIRNLKKAQDDLASVAAQFKSEIKRHEAEITSLAEKVNSGWEMRSVVCREIKDYNTGSVYVFRDDTEELIEERAMTAEERQKPLPFKETESPATDETASLPGLPETVSEGGLPSDPKAPLDLPEDNNPFYLGKKGG